ncbi:Hpt domain-containing protein [Hahella sp. SMD15-11]|uniref:Hpt domain-containing protein n=1 Tax=Thermohahella caldifontis TaxID=3142973 RepID=A0AB39UXG0_9GAMM
MATSLEEKLAALSRDYLRNLSGRLDDLNEHWQCLTQARRQDALRDAMIVAHSIAGSAQTFGFPDVSVAARELELAFRAIEEQGLILPLPSHQAGQLEALISRLEVTIRTAQNPESAGR